MRNWRARLTPLQQRIYDRSAAIPTIQLTPPPQLLEATVVLGEALAREDRARVESLSQTIVNHICRQLGVRTVRVQVEGVRPSNRRGELHGLYTQYSGGSTSIQVWMRTAKRGQVVAFRTFLRTCYTRCVITSITRICTYASPTTPRVFSSVSPACSAPSCGSRRRRRHTSRGNPSRPW